MSVKPRFALKGCDIFYLLLQVKLHKCWNLNVLIQFNSNSTSLSIRSPCLLNAHFKKQTNSHLQTSPVCKGFLLKSASLENGEDFDCVQDEMTLHFTEIKEFDTNILKNNVFD